MKLGVGRFRSVSRIRGRAALPKERRQKTWGVMREETGTRSGLVDAKRPRRSMSEGWWWLGTELCRRMTRTRRQFLAWSDKIR